MINNSIILKNYVPKKYHGYVALIKAREIEDGKTEMCEDLYNGWKEYALNIQIFSTPGQHSNLFTSDYIESLAKIINKILNFSSAVDLKNMHADASMDVYQSYSAIINNDIFILKKTINLINLNTQDKNGKTLLHWAMLYINFEMINLLLANGASPYIQDNEGNTVIKQVEMSANQQLQQIFISYSYINKNRVDHNELSIYNMSQYHIKNNNLQIDQEKSLMQMHDKLDRRIYTSTSLPVTFFSREDKLRSNFARAMSDREKIKSKYVQKEQVVNDSIVIEQVKMEV
jgi:hypothetical protein